MGNELEKIVIECPECRQKLRVPLFKTKALKVNCQRCKTEFSFNCKDYRKSQNVKKAAWFILCSVLFAGTVTLPFVLKGYLTKDLEQRKTASAEELNQAQKQYSEQTEELRKTKSEELKKVDTDEHRNQLKMQTKKYYKDIWEGRSNYDSRYAISKREKAQLEMQALSKDRTKSIEQIIRSIAAKASPDNSTISVHQRNDGTVLDIDFDMSELSSGEEGSRTKHDTVESLKKEVVKLVSRVTNDVYQFSKDLDLKSISIGCRHYVNVQYDYGNNKDYLGFYPNKRYETKSNTVLYKVRLDKKDLKELKTNPFLNIYSTTKYLKVEHDEFSNLTISYEK